MMHEALSKIVSYFKNEKFVLDKDIPISFLIIFVLKRLVMLIRFVVCFRTIKLAFLGGGGKIICKSKIKVSDGVSISENVHIDALSRRGISLGKNVSIGKNSQIECTGSLKDLGLGVVLEDNVGIGSNSFLGCAGGIHVGSDVIMGNYVSFHSENHNHHLSDLPIRSQGVNRKGIVIENNCWIGAKVTILDGVVIGSGSIVAAGAVVIAGIYPTNSILAGVPAKVIRTRNC